MNTGQFDWIREIEDFANKFKVYVKDATTEKEQEKPSTVPVSVFRDATSLYIELEIPGVRKEDVKIAIIDANVIEITGRKSARDGGSYTTLSDERWYGQFSRRVRVSDTASYDVQKASASFTDGVLRISIPRIETSNVAGVSIPIQ